MLSNLFVKQKCKHNSLLPLSTFAVAILQTNLQKQNKKPEFHNCVHICFYFFNRSFTLLTPEPWTRFKK